MVFKGEAVFERDDLLRLPVLLGVALVGAAEPVAELDRVDCAVLVRVAEDVPEAGGVSEAVGIAVTVSEGEAEDEDDGVEVSVAEAEVEPDVEAEEEAEEEGLEVLVSVLGGDAVREGVGVGVLVRV